MPFQYRTTDYYSLILVGHGPTLLIIGGAMVYTAAYTQFLYTYVMNVHQGQIRKILCPQNISGLIAIPYNDPYHGL